MGLLKNRIRTITGENTSWVTATGRLLFYTLHPKRYWNVLKKLLNRVFRPTPNYHNWIQQRLIKSSQDGNYNNSIHFIILSEAEQQQTYPHVTYVSSGNIPFIETVNTYVISLEPGDRLHPHACALIAEEIARTKADIITFDSDEMIGNRRVNPLFMPSWSPVKQWFDEYIQRSVCVRLSSIGTKLERVCWNESLRQMTLTPLSSSRITEVLLSTTNNPDTTYHLGSITSKEELVSIIIPTHNKSHLVKQCIESIITRSSYTNYEIILVDNNSSEPELAELIQNYQNQLKERFVYVKAAYVFNFSQLVNDGAKQSKGNYLVLLNNDTEVKTSDWLEQLLLIASHPQAGAVGAKLLYPDDTIQHAGIVLYPQNISRHVYLGRKENEQVYRNAINTLQQYSAVTAACMMVNKEKFNRVSGFDTTYRVEYNDLDFCLRLMEAGFHNIYTPYAVLYHYESASRQHPMASRKSAKQHYAERAQMERRWKSYIQNDPYWHPLRDLFRL